MRALVLALALVVAIPAAWAADSRAKTSFTVSPRERFALHLWLNGEAAKTAAAQDEVLRIWGHLKLRDIVVETGRISKAKAAKTGNPGASADSEDFPDAQAPFSMDLDELEAVVRLATPREDRPMPTSFSLVLGPMRVRLDAVIAAARRN